MRSKARRGSESSCRSDRLLQLVDVEQAAVEVGNAAEQLLEFCACASLAAEPFVEQAQQEVAVEGVELVLAVLVAHTRRAGCGGSRGRRRGSPSAG